MKRWLLLVLSAVVLLSTVEVISVPPVAEAGARPRCHGEIATLVGTNRADTILGGNRRDVVVAKGGNDLILTSGGNDVICAGGGKDVVDGFKGLDHTWVAQEPTCVPPAGAGSTGCITSARPIRRLRK